jgi:hypothetical protein
MGPPNVLPTTYGVLSLAVKQLGYKDEYLPSASGEVKNVWSYTSIPSYILTVRCLTKHRDNITFTINCMCVHACTRDRTNTFYFIRRQFYFYSVN